MSEKTEKQSVLLFLWICSKVACMCRVWQAEVHDEERGLHHQARGDLHHGDADGRGHL